MDQLMKEKMAEGWIKLYRSIQKNWIWEDPQRLKWWLTILLEVNHSDQKFQYGYDLIEVKRGESCKSLNTWSKLFGVSTKTVRRFFKLLEKDGMVSIKKVGNGPYSLTLVAVRKYAVFQDSSPGYVPDKSSISPSKGTDTSSISPGSVPTNNNVKNENNEKNEKEIPHENFFLKNKWGHLLPLTKNQEQLKLDDKDLTTRYEFLGVPTPLRDAFDLFEPVWKTKRFQNQDHFNNWFIKACSESKMITKIIKLVE